jgi:hypothetical protein
MARNERPSLLWGMIKGTVLLVMLACTVLFITEHVAPELLPYSISDGIDGSVPAAQVTASGVAPFSFQISPASATGHAGDTITYSGKVTAQPGFTGPVQLSLAASAGIFHQTYDLGVLQPPYPQSFTYPLTIPDSLPANMNLNGVVTATSGTAVQKQTVHLAVV